MGCRTKLLAVNSEESCRVGGFIPEGQKAHGLVWEVGRQRSSGHRIKGEKTDLVNKTGSICQTVSHKGQLGKQSKRKDKSKGVKWGDSQGEHLRGGMGNDKLGPQTKGGEANDEQQKSWRRDKTKAAAVARLLLTAVTLRRRPQMSVWQPSFIKPGDSRAVPRQPVPGTGNKRSAVRVLDWNWGPFLFSAKMTFWVQTMAGAGGYHHPSIHPFIHSLI